jgi:hypothetical protein
MAGRVSNQIVEDGLVLYLDAANRLSYVSGSTVWNDLTPNGNNGTLINGPNFDSANAGSILFDGINDYVDLSTYSNNLIWNSLWPKGISINTVFKTANPLPAIDDGKSIFSRLTSPLSGTAVGNNFNFSLQSNSKLRFWIGGTLGYVPAFTNATINASVIYHVVVTWDGSNTRFYINGLLDSTTAAVNPLTNSASSLLRLGGSIVSWDFPGNIYNLSVYDRALTDQEALQNFNALKWRYGL